MQPGQQAIDSALQELEKLRRLLMKNKEFQQVRTVEETSIISATAHAWSNNHRPALAQI